MKNLIGSLIFICLLAISESAFNQHPAEDQQAIEMLREFYIARSKLEWTLPNISKVDSLQTKYCSKKLQKEIREQFKLTGLDHDLLTNDWGIDSLSMKTLSISQEPKHDNNFNVSYIIWDDIVPNVSKKQIKVTFTVTVKKEDGLIKVDAIE